MALVKKKIDLSKEITSKQKRMLEEAGKRPLEYDEDNPPLTKEELAQFQRVYDTVKKEQMDNRKQNVTLRLSPQTVRKAKAFGKGYTSVLSRIIEKVLDNPTITEQLIK